MIDALLVFAVRAPAEMGGRTHAAFLATTECGLNAVSWELLGSIDARLLTCTACRIALSVEHGR